MNILNAKLALLALVAVVPEVSCGAAAGQAQRFPPLTAYGNTYPNTCSPVARSQLHKKLLEGKIADQAQLWKTINTLLCSDPTAANTRAVAAFIENKVSDTTEGTGQDPSYDTLLRSTNTAASLMASRNAWDATLDVGGDGVNLSYHSDEVCVTSRKFRYTKARWRIFEVSQACD